jgi:hypothetical protein
MRSFASGTIVVARRLHRLTIIARRARRSSRRYRLSPNWKEAKNNGSSNCILAQGGKATTDIQPSCQSCGVGICLRNSADRSIHRRDKGLDCSRTNCTVPYQHTSHPRGRPSYLHASLVLRFPSRRSLRAKAAFGRQMLS